MKTITSIDVVRIIRRQEQRERRKAQAYMKYTREELTAEGFSPWFIPHNDYPESWRAPFNVPIIFMRESWDKPVIATREDMPPEMNVVGLYWKPTGIAKELAK